MQNKNLLTVIFQGAVNEGCIESLRHSIQSIKKIAPHVNIIISTWESCAVPEMGQDFTIKSPDLLSYTPSEFKANNLHRQLLSTSAALLKISCGNVAKLRTDLLVFAPELLLSEMTRQRVPANSFITKITTICYSSVDPIRNNLPLLYHPCDWVYIGCLDDLKKLFSVPMPNEDYFYRGIPLAGVNKRLGKYAEGMRSEEYICSFSLCRQHWENGITNISPSKYSLIRSNKRIANNFDIVNIKEIGLKSVKHKTGSFDPNRFTSLAVKLWSMKSSDPFLGLRVRHIIKIYYSQRYFFSLFRLIKRKLSR